MINYLEKDLFFGVLDEKFKSIYSRIDAVMGRPRAITNLIEIKDEVKDSIEHIDEHIKNLFNENVEADQDRGRDDVDGSQDGDFEPSAADWHRSGGLNLTTVEGVEDSRANHDLVEGRQPVEQHGRVDEVSVDEDRYQDVVGQEDVQTYQHG